MSAIDDLNAAIAENHAELRTRDPELFFLLDSLPYAQTWRCVRRCAYLAWVLVHTALGVLLAHLLRPFAAGRIDRALASALRHITRQDATKPRAPLAEPKRFGAPELN